MVSSGSFQDEDFWEFCPELCAPWWNVVNTEMNTSVFISVQHPSETSRRDEKNKIFLQNNNKKKTRPHTIFFLCVFLAGVPSGQRHHQGHQQDISCSRLLQRHWRRRAGLPLQDLQGDTWSLKLHCHDNFCKIKQHFQNFHQVQLEFL